MEIVETESRENVLDDTDKLVVHRPAVGRSEQGMEARVGGDIED